jgi:hypothetical protein
MGIMFSDELTKPRQALYWDLLRGHKALSIEAWEFACTQALLYEKFHKVPLPATLMEYVREYNQQETQRLGRENYLLEEKRLIALEQERAALLMQEFEEKKHLAIEQPRDSWSEEEESDEEKDWV